MPKATTVLVIGAHREELAFGEQVARALSDLPIEIYRIPLGITGRHPRQDQVFRYRLYHQELYLQLRQQLKDSTRLLIDLHAGQDSQGPAADLYCRDQGFLDCLARARSSAAGLGADARIRMIPLVDPGSGAAGRSPGGAAPTPVAHALIPRQIWGEEPPLYLAIESYLREPGPGASDDWALARALIQGALQCEAMREAATVALGKPLGAGG